MALILPSSSLNLPEAKLNTPYESLSLPLNLPEIQQPKGFFETLRKSMLDTLITIVQIVKEIQRILNI